MHLTMAPTPAAERLYGRYGWQLALLGIALTVAFMTPALINRFPLVMEDSIGYSGQGVGWIRSKVPPILIYPLYRVWGYWALPLFNAVVNAAAWLLLIYGFRMRKPWLVLPFAVAALQPIYTSAVLVDAWFFPAVVFLVFSVKWSSPFLGLAAGLLLAGHGSGLPLAIVFILVAVFLFGMKAVRMTFLALVMIVSANTFVNYKYFPDTPPMSRTFVAARLFSVHPELLRHECERSGNEVLCEAAVLVEELKQNPETAGRRDYFWDLARILRERFDLRDFERNHAKAILLDGLTYSPFVTAGVVAQDFFSFYCPGTKLDFNAVLSEPMPPAYDGSLQADGLWQHDQTLTLLTGLRFVFYAAFIAAVAIGWRSSTQDMRKWFSIIVLVCLANDGLFALLSGPPDRYHHRILPLYAAAACILWLASRVFQSPSTESS
ncbi:MAG: hypothetical protein ACRCSX_11475 [Allorhizobium sp.]